MQNDEQEAVGMEVESSTVALLNRSEIDMQIATAHKFPRSIKRFRTEALQMVTLNESVAESCIYALPRGSKTIEGPSARFAEVIASAWGNCRAGARVVSDSGEFITAQGVFHDLERNVAITYEVQRRITDKHGARFNTDMIGVTGNAASSIALRNAILKGVPKAFWDDMYQAARAIIMGDFKTLANRRAEALKAFISFGVSNEQVFAKLGVSGIEDIGLEHLVTLRGLLTAIREGDTTPEQAFTLDGDAKAPKANPDKTVADPYWTEKQFAKTMGKQGVSVQKGDSTPESLIEWMEGKGPLNENQIAHIKGLATQNKPEEPALTGEVLPPDGVMSAEEVEAARQREIDEAANG